MGALHSCGVDRYRALLAVGCATASGARPAAAAGGGDDGRDSAGAGDGGGSGGGGGVGSAGWEGDGGGRGAVLEASELECDACGTLVVAGYMATHASVRACCAVLARRGPARLDLPPPAVQVCMSRDGGAAMLRQESAHMMAIIPRSDGPQRLAVVA